MIIVITYRPHWWRSLIATLVISLLATSTNEGDMHTVGKLLIQALQRCAPHSREMRLSRVISFADFPSGHFLNVYSGVEIFFGQFDCSGRSWRRMKTNVFCTNSNFHRCCR